MTGQLIGRLVVVLTRWAHRRGTHHYLSTGCLHGDLVLPDGRTGHTYCQGDTGRSGAKEPARCKFCGALCQCGCHQAPGLEPSTAREGKEGQ